MWGDLPDMYSTQAQWRTVPGGKCGHTRQIPTAHVMYHFRHSQKSAKIFLTLYYFLYSCLWLLGFHSNISMMLIYTVSVM